MYFLLFPCEKRDREWGKSVLSVKKEKGEKPLFLQKFVNLHKI